MMNVNRAIRTTVIVYLLTLSACAGMRPAPEVSLVDLRFGEMRLLETALEAEVRVENERNEPLSLSGAVHKIYVNDIYLGKGMTDESLNVPRLGSATQRVTLRVDNLRVLTRLQDLMEQGLLHYRIDSTLYGTGLLSRMYVTREGRLSFSERQQRFVPELGSLR